MPGSKPLDDANERPVDLRGRRDIGPSRDICGRRDIGRHHASTPAHRSEHLAYPDPFAPRRGRFPRAFQIKAPGGCTWGLFSTLSCCASCLAPADGLPDQLEPRSEFPSESRSVLQWGPRSAQQWACPPALPWALRSAPRSESLSAAPAARVLVGSGVFVGGTGVFVGGIGVLVGSAVAWPAALTPA